MSKWSDGWACDNFDDPVEVVLSTDKDINAAIERAEEKADSGIMGDDDLIGALKEEGIISDDTSDEDADLMYPDDEDDAVSIEDMDADDYLESWDADEVEDDMEDDDIDTVIDQDPDAPIECDCE